MSVRNGTISFLKFILAIFLMSFHYNSVLNNNNVGFFSFKLTYLCTDFFFIISGFYFGKKIMKNWNNNNNVYLDNLNIIWNKFKKFLPYSLIATILSGGILVFYKQRKIVDLALSLFSAFFIGMFGITDYLILGPIWYISAMLIAMFILYPIVIKLKKNYAYYIGPLIIMFGLGYIFQQYGTLNIYHSQWNGLFYSGLLRAIIELNIGIIIAFEIDSINKKLDRFKNINVLLTCTEIYLFYILFTMMLFYSKVNQIEFVLLFIIVITLIISFTGRSYTTKIFSKKFFFYLEQLSLPIYINHYIPMYFFFAYGIQHKIDYSLSFSICAITTIVFSIIEFEIINRIQRKKRIS